MSKVKESGIFKIVSITLVISFVAFDISWANPISPSDSSTLSPQGIFQQGMMTNDGIVRQNAVFADMKFRTFVQSIGKALFEQGLSLNYLESTLTSELAKLKIDGLDLSKVTFEGDVASVLYVKDGVRYAIQIALKDSPAADTLKGYDWYPLDTAADADSRYVIKVLPEEATGTKNFPARSDEDSIEFLISGLRDTDASISEFAEAQLVKKGASAVPALVTALNTEDYYVLLRVLSVLSKIKPDEAIDALTKMLDNTYSDIRSKALAILGQIGSKAAFNGAIKALEDKSDQIRLEAIAVLSAMGDEAKDAAPALMKVMRYSEDQVRSGAAKWGSPGYKIADAAKETLFNMGILLPAEISSAKRYSSVNVIKNGMLYCELSDRPIAVSGNVNKEFLSGLERISDRIIISSREGSRENLTLFVYEIGDDGVLSQMYHVYGGDCTYRDPASNISKDGHILVSQDITGTYDNGDVGDVYLVIMNDGNVIKQMPSDYSGKIVPLSGEKWLEINGKNIELYSADNPKACRAAFTLESIPDVIRSLEAINKVNEVIARTNKEIDGILRTTAESARPLVQAMITRDIAGMSALIKELQELGRQAGADQIAKGKKSPDGKYIIADDTHYYSTVAQARADGMSSHIMSDAPGMIGYTGGEVVKDQSGKVILSTRKVFEIDEITGSGGRFDFISDDIVLATASGWREDMIARLYRIGPDGTARLVYTVYGGDCSNLAGSAEKSLSKDGRLMLAIEVTGTYDGGNVGDSYTVLRFDGNIIKSYPVSFKGDIKLFDGGRWEETVAGKVTPYSTLDLKRPVTAAPAQPSEPPTGTKNFPNGDNKVAAAAAAKAAVPDNLTMGPVIKEGSRKIVEKAQFKYPINKNMDKKVLKHINLANVPNDDMGRWNWQIDACLNQICSNISFPGQDKFPNILTIKVVSGMPSLCKVDIAKDLQDSVIYIDESLLDSLEAKWLLYAELEHKILRMCLGSLRNRLPIAAEDIALIMVYLARFNSFEERKRIQTIKFLREHPDLDKKEFADILRDAENATPEEMTEKISKYLVAKKMCNDEEWALGGMPQWNSTITMLAYSNILVNLLKQDILISPPLKILPPQSSKAFWSATEWMKLFESASARLSGSKGRDATGKEHVQTVNIHFNRVVRGRENISLNIPIRLTSREYAILGRLIGMYINDHIVNEGSSNVTITTSDVKLEAAIKKTLETDYPKMYDYVKKYYPNRPNKEIVNFVTDNTNEVRNYKKNTIIGLDLGGSSNVKTVVIKDGNIIRSITCKLPDEMKAENIKTTEQYVTIFSDLIDKVISESGVKREDVYSVGISWAGAVRDSGEIAAVSKIVKGVAENPNEQPPLSKIMNLGSLLTEKTGISTRIVNDGDSLAFGLATYAEMKDTLCLGFGTSLAVGYIDEKGRLVSEFGEGSKTIADMADRASAHTGTDVMGVVQQYASQAGVIRVAEGYEELKELLEAVPVEKKASRVGDELELYNPNAEAVLNKVADFIAVAIYKLHRHYRMEHVILSGGVMNSESGIVILAKVREKIRAHFPIVDPANIETSGTIERKIEGMTPPNEKISYANIANAVGAAQAANILKQDKEATTFDTGTGTKNFPAGPIDEPKNKAGAVPAIFDTLEAQVNNNRASIVNSANELVGTIPASTSGESPDVAVVDRFQSTAEVKARIEGIIRAAESPAGEPLAGGNAAKVAELRSRMNQLEAEGVIGSIVTLARKAKYEGQKLIIGLETDWIPNYNEAKSRQREAMNPVMREIEDIPSILRSMGLDNVILVHASSAELAGNIIAQADKTQTRYSNVVILASKDTVNSGSFSQLRSAPGEEKAFIAGVDPSELAKLSEDTEESLKILNIKILEMLSIVLDLASGKEPPNIPMITSYERSLRTVMLLPRAEPKDYEDLKRSYLAQQAALAAA